MSKAEKLRDRLAAIQKEREEFEKHKKELENEMHIGKQNIGKIQKGLRHNFIVNDPKMAAESNLSTSNNSTSTNPRKKKDSNPNNVPSSSMLAGLNSPNTHGLPPSISFMSSPGGDNSIPTPTPVMANIIPSGPRISDWCFTGTLESSPPMVKSRELYENVRLLGRGAFGEVNLVKNIEDNKLFAIKTILCPKDSELGNILREIRFLRANRHPCIIDVHDAFITSNPRIVHIVMHYCESGTLASVISSARKNRTYLPETQVLKWFIQLALALNFLHANHTLHRDLKPMNVMLTEGGDLLKVADFGLAVDIETGEDCHSEEAGTPYYTAPEMIQRENYSYPADCWSFGIILYQLLTLDRPFEGSSTAELVKSILTSEPSPITAGHYSDEIKAISLGLLRKNPAERLSTNNLVTDSWLMPKVLNFPQQYRPKYLEERIRRSHVKQLESQIELIQLNNTNLTNERLRLERANTSQSGGFGNSAFSRETSFSNKSGNDNNSKDNSTNNSTIGATLQGMDHLPLDVLPTLLETLGGSISTSEKVTINHKSFIIDDESIIQTLNAQQMSMATEHHQNQLLTNGTSDHTSSHPNISPIKQAKADINIVDGVFGNEKFISIDVKITPKATSRDLGDDLSDELEGGSTKMKSSHHPHAPVLELHYSTEIKLPNGANPDILGHHHHHHHHHTLGSSASRKVHVIAPDDHLVPSDRHHNPQVLLDSIAGTIQGGAGEQKQNFIEEREEEEELEGRDKLKTLVSRSRSNDILDEDGRNMAIVRQKSTSLINGKILNSSVEEILTHVDSLDIDRLQMDQFQRMTDTIENVLHHSEELLSEKRSSSQKRPPFSSREGSVGGNIHGMEEGGVSEKKETSNTSSSFSLSSPKNVTGGRIGKHIAEAIENDHEFEKQLNHVESN